LADLTRRTVWTCALVETAAMGAAVQATAALENTRIDVVASAWAPKLEFAADPNPHTVEAAQAARNAYRAAAARILDENENSPNRTKT
jgi:xylulokinase